MDRITTIEDIAKAAGVGKGTVDRVIHNRGRVAPETRAKVLQCIEDMHYKPNTVARMLARKRRYRIAICYHDKEQEFWNQIRRGVDIARKEYEQMGVEITPMILPEIDVEKQLAVIRRVIDEHYDGLAIVPYCDPAVKDAINEAMEKGVEVVTFNNREEGINACYVGLDGIQSGRTAGRLMSMIAAPNSTYVIITSHSSLMMNMDERAIGFMEVLGECRKDMKYLGSDVFEEDYEAVYRCVVEHLKKGEVNAFYATTECSAAVGRAIHDMKMDGKVSVVGHDLTPAVVNYIRSGCINATIGQDPERQGYASVDKICRKLLTGEPITDEYTKISIVVAENVDYV